MLFTTLMFLCEIVLSSTCHTMVYWLHSIFALAAHSSYGLRVKPKSIRAPKCNLFQRRALWTHPCSALLRTRHSNFLFFSFATHFYAHQILHTSCLLFSCKLCQQEFIHVGIKMSTSDMACDNRSLFACIKYRSQHDRVFMYCG